MGDVTELHPKGPWLLTCPECGGTSVHLYEHKDGNFAICADPDCANPMGVTWDEDGAE